MITVDAIGSTHGLAGTYSVKESAIVALGSVLGGIYAQTSPGDPLVRALLLSNGNQLLIKDDPEVVKRIVLVLKNEDSLFE